MSLSKPPSLASVTRSLALVTHSVASVTHSLALMTHSLASVTHSLALVTHNLASVTHSLALVTHNLALVTHSLASNKATHHDPSQTVPSTVDQVFKYKSHWGTISFKPPQVLWDSTGLVGTHP